MSDKDEKEMDVEELMERARAAGKTDLCRFVEDMRAAGLKVRYYRGRFRWRGPAVAVADLQEALGATQVRCQWDHLGLDKVVYPRESL